MVRHDLRLGDYYGGRHGYAGTVVGFTGRFEEGALVLRDPTGLELRGGWDALRDQLRLLPADRWHDLLIWRTWPAAEAIAAGRSFATDGLIPVLRPGIGVSRHCWTGVASHRLDLIRSGPARLDPNLNTSGA